MGRGEWGTGRERAASRVSRQREEKTASIVCSHGSWWSWADAGAGAWQTGPSHVGTGRLRHTRAMSVHTHTPHTTPHAHTLGQHIGYEGGHPPTQGPHQQSVSRETKSRAVGGGGSRRSWSQWREAGTLGHPVSILATPCEVGRELMHPVRTPQHSTSTPRWRGRRVQVVAQLRPRAPSRGSWICRRIRHSLRS